MIVGVWASNEHNILHSPAQEGKKRSSIDKTIHITTRAAHGPSGALTQAEDTIAEVLVVAILLSHERALSCLVLHSSNRVYIPTFSLWDTPRLSGTHKHVTQTQIQRLDGNPVRKYAEQSCTMTSQGMLGVETDISGHFEAWGLAFGMVAVVCIPGKLSSCDQLAPPLCFRWLWEEIGVHLTVLNYICDVLQVVMSSRCQQDFVPSPSSTGERTRGKPDEKTEMTQIHGISRGGPRAEPSPGVVRPGPYIMLRLGKNMITWSSSH